MQKLLILINRHKVILILLSLIILLKVIIVREIGNRDWEPDGYNHVLYVNSVFSNIPSSLKLGIEVWAKPLYTYLFGLISLIIGGRTLFNVQILNISIWSLTSFIIYLSANLLGGKKILSIFIGILTSITFIVFRDSMTSLTEPVFTLFLVLSIYLLLKSKYFLSTLCISLLPLGRMEGFIFLSIYFIFLLYISFFKKEFKIKKLLLCLVILLLPSFIWNYLGYLITKHPFFIFTNGYPTSVSAYGHGGWLDYIKGFIVQDPVTLILFIFGFIVNTFLAFKKRINIIIILITIYSIVLIIFNVVIWKFGMFGSAGLMRYFVPIIPLMIVSSINFLNSTHLKRLTAPGILYFIIFLQLVFTIGSMYLYKGWFMGLTNYPETPKYYENAGLWVKNKQFLCDVYSNQPSLLYYADRNINNSKMLFDQFLNLDAVENNDFILLADSKWFADYGLINGKNKYEISKLTQFHDISILYFDSKIDLKNCNY